MFLDTDKAVAQVDGGRVKACGERVQEVRTVIGIEGRAKALRHRDPVVEFEELAALHIARVDAGGLSPNRGNLIANADCV